MTAAAPISPDGTAPVALENRIWALVPCAGSGTRAGTVLPKQYRQIAGQTLIAHTLDALLAVARIVRILVVIAPDDAFLAAAALPPAARWSSVGCGGATRAQSVANGLAALQQQGAANADWVLVHDAARCLVQPAWIDRLIDACLPDAVGGLLAHPVPDTLKMGAQGRVVETADRSHQWLAQTPQMFRIGMLRQALLAAGAQVTDESSAMEAIGHSPLLVRGSALNFKVTHPEDFVLAQALLAGRAHNPIPTPIHKKDYDYP